jgi:hypothetical protein
VLRGILSKTRDVAIVRIDRTGNTNAFWSLDPHRLEELANNPLLSSARVLDGLFYSAAVVVEADSDVRFYHAVSNKRRADLDLHFVNADNKQTIPRITKMYRDMGVRCAGIVDFDVLNDRAEFTQQLQALACSEQEMKQAQIIREAIAQAAKELSPEERLEDVKRQMTALLHEISLIQSREPSSDEAASLAQTKLLQRIERSSHEIANATKAWKQFKQQGQAALPTDLQSQFAQLANMCALKGLFINPRGELESMLTEYGIEYTSDKRAWIIRALQLLPELQVNDEKYPWKFMKTLHEQLCIEEVRKDERGYPGERKGAACAVTSVGAGA